MDEALEDAKSGTNECLHTGVAMPMACRLCGELNEMV